MTPPPAPAPATAPATATAPSPGHGNGNGNGNGNGTAKSPSARAPRRTGKPQHMNGPLYKQANSNVVLVRRLKRKNEGPMKQLTRWFVDNQIGARP